MPNPGPAGVLQLQHLFLRIINLAVEGAFIVLVIMLLWAGIRYLTSGGDPKPLQQANSTLTWALLGLSFLALAWIILRLISALTGVDITLFCIGFPGAPTKCP